MWEHNQYKKVRFITKEFDKLVTAQGWNVKWEISTRCSCYKEDLGEPDYSCEYCGGRGYFYRTPSEVRMPYEQAKVLSGNKIQIKNIPTNIIKIYNKARDEEYTVSAINGTEITIEENVLLGHYGIFVDYEYSLIGTVTEIRHTTSLIKDEIYTTNQYISSISSIHNNSNGEDYTAIYFTDNKIKLSGPAEPGHDIEIVYNYIKPIKMIITEAKERQESKQIGEYIEGDAQLTFMPWFNVGNRDKITLLDISVGTRFNELLQKGECDRLKTDEVLDILEVRDTETIYQKDVDYKFVGTNEIFWIGGGSAPSFGEHYSVLYTARREYIIWGEVWQDRYHGEILLPRRLVARRLEKFNFTRDNSFGEH